ncbi:MAG: hypothetical protein OXC98_13915 [bacterium]|nr:hypothetical protein [Acidimicrobiia bacterium]MCY4651436.1 hypothetical protein [bacterium]
MPSNQRRPFPRVREHSRNSNSGRHVPGPTPTRSPQTNGESVDDTLHPDSVILDGANGAGNSEHEHPPGVSGNGTSANGTAVGSPTVTTEVVVPTPNGQYKVTEETVRNMWQASEPAVAQSRLQPSSSHSLRQITAHRSRSGMWTTLGVVALAAASTVALLMFFGGSAQGDAEARAAVENAAVVAASTVEDSLATLESLQAGSSFTPELVSAISTLGETSRSLVETAAVLPTDEPSMAEIRMSATALAGRVSRLGETFGAAFSYQGQLGPNLAFPELNAPLDISRLAENASLLTDWQFRLEQAVSSQPAQPRLLQNQQALEATLPYIAVHRHAYSDAMGNGQSQQAETALSQMASLISAIRQDFDRAYREIAEIAEAEIASLTADFQSLLAGI